jgi:hypothetical protein
MDVRLQYGKLKAFNSLRDSDVYRLIILKWIYMMYLLIAIALTPGGSSIVHIYT